MTTFDRRFFARGLTLTAMVSAGVLATMRFANAIPGGRTRDSLSFSGTLQGRPSPQMLSFVFKKAGATVCSPPAVSVTLGTGGQFTAEIPIDACPATLFDGGDVVFDISVGSTLVVHDRPVTPVPYARYADRVGTPDCPTGYERDASATGIVLCRRALVAGAFDEVVRVGSGQSAFWIDRYEASVWQNADGSGTRYGAGVDDYPPTFPNNGQVQTSNVLYALSKVGELPSVRISWFQMQVACASSGKRLPTSYEWQLAVVGTNDPGRSDGAGGVCDTGTAMLRRTGLGTRCVSNAGAQDMIGGVNEVMSEWMASPQVSGLASPGSGWPGEFRGDGAYGVYSRGANSPANIPSEVVRGGTSGDAEGAGAFYFDLRFVPTDESGLIGFRCMIPR